jgi:hypothetical protein
MKERIRILEIAGLICEASASKKMLNQYLETALWSSTDDNDKPLDDNYTIRDIDKSSINTAKKDLNKFLSKAQKYIDEDDIDDGQVGHDFWLTRNGHGAGFWDRGGEHDDALAKLCKPFRELNPYVGDDGKVYIE